ncbi:MAG: sulfite exporter TauE/SafE family protein [Methylococcales bacterium]|nr:sulfite exporter TauE/SafE family protein [Methylococcales bacterium]
MLTTLVIGLIMGLMSGLLAGLFGLGGGVVLVPMLLVWLRVTGWPEDSIMVSAVATSLASIVFTSAWAVRKHHLRGAVIWSFVRRLAVMIGLGTLLGATFARSMPASALKILFAFYLLVVGLRMIRRVTVSSGAQQAGPVTDAINALIIGALSAMLGIGGGTLTVPYLLKRGLVMTQAVATASALGFPIAVFGSLGYLFWGWRDYQSPGYFMAETVLLGILLGSALATPLAVALAHRLQAERLRQAFAVVMLLVAAKLLIPALQQWLAGGI